MRVALLFIDGVGVGANDPGVNPLARERYLLSQFRDGGEPLPLHGQRVDLETTFGVPGRPQSATNQTAIFTGLPAPRVLGQHRLGFPNEPLKALLKEHSVILRLKRAGRSSTFANAYPLAYLQALGLPHRAAHPERSEAESRDPSTEARGERAIPAGRLRRLRPSASTVAYQAADIPLRTLDDAERGLGLTHDIEGRMARLRGLQVPARTPEDAATVFWRIASGHDFTLFEHFLADEAGHGRDFALAQDALGTFDRFARAVVALRPQDAAVLIVSDHGNVEDLSTRSHTLNPVALLTFGAPPEALTPLKDVSDVTRLTLGLVGAA